MNIFDSQQIIAKYWFKLLKKLLFLLQPFIWLVSQLGRRFGHITSYLYALVKSKWYHWRCELPAGRFIFVLYLCIIGTGTTLLVLSQYKELQLGSFNIQTLLSAIPKRWEIAEIINQTSEKNFFEYLLWAWQNALDEIAYLWHNGHLGPLNRANLDILIDALFTATSATCLTGMTTTDITKYPPLVIITLVILGAASLMIIALTFNINSFFQTESSSHGALSLDEYGEGRRMGHFTIKAMYGSIIMGVIALTLYFLPPDSVILFFKKEIARAAYGFKDNFIFFFVWGSIFTFIVYLLYMLGEKIRFFVLRMVTSNTSYYLSVTALLATVLMWLYYGEAEWTLEQFIFAVQNASWLSISAFTNAGFDTYTNDLNIRLGSQHASQIMTVCIMLLIFFGSLGMQVVKELPHVFAEIYYTIASRRFSFKRLGMKISFHTKLVLLTNIILWLLGGFMFWFFETTKGVTLTDLTGSEIFFTSAFQAINMRTAGFSIHADVSAYSHPTLMLIMVMMLIGGSPNSLSGGMKVSTIATLFLVAKSLLLRQDTVHAFGETIEEETISKAMTTFVLTICTLTLAIILIFSFYDGLQEDYFKVAFDVVGAFTTIGLNTGISDWNIPCKLILIVCMCFGKIGVLTIGMTMYNTSYKKKSAARR